MLVNALVIEHARTVTVIITWMYKWKWNWYVDNEVYVWRAREGYVTALSAASHACVDCPDRTDEESMNKLRTIAATSSVGPNEGSSVRGTDGSWTRWIEIWIINSLDRCFNSRSGTVGNDRKHCNRYGSCSSAGSWRNIWKWNYPNYRWRWSRTWARTYAMDPSLLQQLQSMHASTVLILLLLYEGSRKTVIVETMCLMGLADDKPLKNLERSHCNHINWERFTLEFDTVLSFVALWLLQTVKEEVCFLITALDDCKLMRLKADRMAMMYENDADYIFILPASYCIKNILVINREKDWKALHWTVLC